MKLPSRGIEITESCRLRLTGVLVPFTGSLGSIRHCIIWAVIVFLLTVLHLWGFDAVLVNR